MRCSTAELAAHVGGELVGPEVGIAGASIDSRTLRPGQLYVPIVAERPMYFEYYSSWTGWADDGHVTVGYSP